MTQDTDFNPCEIIDLIKGILENDKDFHITEHALERMEERNIIRSDLYYLLKNGDCMSDRTLAKPEHLNLWKYKITGKTPNSGSREISTIVVVPDSNGGLKIVTVMWQDIK